MKIKTKWKKFFKNQIFRFYILFSVFQQSCKVCLNTYHTLKLDYPDHRNLLPVPITKRKIPNPAKITQRDSKQKTQHIDRENFTTSWQCKASHRSSDPSIIRLFYLGSFGTSHSPYSPDLVASNFHLFHYLKHHVGSNHYKDDEKVKMAMTSWLSEQVEILYKEGIQNQL